MEYPYQLLPDLTSDEYKELKADIAARGVMVPIEFDEAGNILDGHHRLRACEELGIVDFPRIVRKGMTEQEKRVHARKLNMARRQLTREQKQELIRETLRETPEKSDRQIAKGLGCDKNTVNKQRKALEATGEIHQLKTSIGADGKERTRKPKTEPAKQQEAEPIPEPEPVQEQNRRRPNFCVSKVLMQGRGNALTGKDLSRILGEGVRLVREAIHWERVDGSPVLADTLHGYYLAADEDEARRFAADMRRRAAEIIEAAAGIERGAANTLT